MKLKSVIFFLVLRSAIIFSQTYNCKTKIDVDSIIKCGLKSNIFQSEKITDECKLFLIGSTSSKYMSSKKVEYINFLVQLYSYSDGVFTDHIFTNCGKIFDGCLLDWFKYLYKNRNNDLTRKLFTESISVKMGINENEKNNVNIALDNLVLKLNAKEKKYLNKFRKGLNPNIQE